eukprot:FR738701.1.p1 GENE.FR738701.1~~FR738701.1.p1  ORF type:complete len:234 (-),score=5.36 FR738701.1:123-824(-)
MGTCCPRMQRDRYGKDLRGPVPGIKTGPCQSQSGTYSARGRKSWRNPGRTCFPLPKENGRNATGCLRECESKGTSKCTAANVVPLYNPPGVVEMLAESVNIPTDIVVGSEGVANTDCDMMYMAAKYPGLSNDTLICYGLLPDDDASNEEVDDPWTIIDNDPMDPMFYSTCYRQGTAWEFVGNVECPRCEAANASSVPWRVGRRCISCDEVSRIEELKNYEVAWWNVIDDCEVC